MNTETWNRYREDGDTVSYALGGHTAQKINLATFTSKVSSEKTDVRVRIARDSADPVTGELVPKKVRIALLIEADSSADTADIADAQSDLLAIQNDPTLIANLLNGLLPQAATL